MKAEFLDLNELLDISDGYIHIRGRRIVMHLAQAFAQFRKDLIQMVGDDQARRVLTRFGYFWGRADAMTMKRIFKWESPLELIKAGPRLHGMFGVGKVTIRKLELDQSGDVFTMEVYVHNSVEAEEHLTSIGKSDECSCWKLTGYMSGFATECIGKTIYFAEDQCLAKGDSYCHCIGRDYESWGEDFARHRPYFESDDIKGTVERLTRELQKKTLELSRHRHDMDDGLWAHDPYYAETRSAVFRRTVELAGRVARFDSSVLITGETGVGKEILARYIHRHSHRSKAPFVVVNCAALPETLLESELFGHKAGSFTGAALDRIGLIEQAASGTIFLDEIGDISPGTQLKILRVLQEKEILRVGENESRKIDVRVIAATNRDLSKAVAEGKFREDLLYRLRVIEIPIPPLRERPEDILPTARNIISRLKKRLDLPRLKLDVGCVDYFQAYSWPGNVRELENALERAAVLDEDSVILPENLPAQITREVAPGGRFKDPLSLTLAQVEQEHIRAVLKLMRGNRTRAARALGISQSTLWRKLKEGGDEENGNDNP